MVFKLHDPSDIVRLTGLSAETLGKAYNAWETLHSKYGKSTAIARKAGRKLLHDTYAQFPKLLFPDSIRILELCPASSWEDPLVCRLSLRRLAQGQCEYEALSYVWRDVNDTVELFCNGEKIHITRNLDDGLRQLRLETESRYLWVDAICINQRDMTERGHQVRLMRSIYKKAQRVLIWIGKDEPYIDEFGKEWPSKASVAFDIFQRIIRYSTVKYADLVKLRKDMSAAEIALIRDMEKRREERRQRPTYDPSWEVIEEFFSSRWFWRLWVVQEVVVASSAIVYWGKKTIQWSVVGSVANWLKANYPPSRRIHIFGAYNASYIYQLAIQARRKQLHPFFTIVHSTWLFESTDPKDRVFAMLGIPNSDSDPEHNELFLEPDYSLSTPKIYLAFARRVLSQERSLRLFGAVQHKPGAPPSVPSWVPQWEPRLMEPLVPIDHITNRISDYGLSKRSIFTVDPELLILSGITIDKVSGHTEPISWESHEPTYMHSPDRCNLIQQVQDLLEENSYQLTLARLKCLCWSLTVGRSYDFWSSQDRHWDVFNDLWIETRKHFSAKSWQNIGFETPLLEFEATNQPSSCGIHQFLGSATYGRRVFVTSEGLIGLGPPSMQKDDIVAILFGGFTPFVLRKVDEHYVVIGECYVHGHMDGAAIEEWQEENSEPEEFYLR